MKLLISGLCLSRNLGGPAMALTMVEELMKRISDVEITFAVNPGSYEQEKEWADYYGVKIARRDTFLPYFLNTNPVILLIKKCYRYLRNKPMTFSNTNIHEEIHNEHMAAYHNCDAVINMMGISYVGDRGNGFFHGAASYSNFHYARKHKKPFIHFIQSFGPFDDPLVRFFAKRDFNATPFIPARGKIAALQCKAIVKNSQKVMDFPDCAILLPPAEGIWVLDYLKKINLVKNDYVILSPSSVIFNMQELQGAGTGNNHVLTYLSIARKLIAKGESLLFLPHMYSDNKKECDREVALKVLNLLKVDNEMAYSKCRIVDDDLDVWQAKALISNAKAAIVSRYHALVAAVSTGVPAISIGWNIKYKDLLEYYGAGSMAIDARDYPPELISDKVIEIFSNLESINHKDRLLKNHIRNVERVEFAFDLLALWLDENVRKKG